MNAISALALSAAAVAFACALWPVAGQAASPVHAQAASPVHAQAAPPAGAASCSGCHAESPGVVTPVPRIVGLDASTMVKAMREFRAGARPATVMDRIAKGFSDEEIKAIADWYAGRR